MQTGLKKTNRWNWEQVATIAYKFRQASGAPERASSQNNRQPRMARRVLRAVGAIFAAQKDRFRTYVKRKIIGTTGGSARGKLQFAAFASDWRQLRAGV